MPASAYMTFSGKKLEPFYEPQSADELAVKLPVSVDYLRGTVLGETIGTDEVQSITQTGGPTGGTFTISFAGQTTAAIAYNATAAAIRDALEALSTIGDGNIEVTGGPLNVAVVTLRFVGALAGANQAAVTTTDASLTGGSSPGHTIATVTGGVVGVAGTFKAYDNDATDGSQTARGILAFDATVDSAGLITLSATAGQGGGELGQKVRSVPMYVKGYFKTSELVGLDTRAVAQLGRLVSGTIADGVLWVG